MLQTFEYRDSEGDIRGVAVGESQRTVIENDGTTTVFIMGVDNRVATIFFLLPEESVHVRVPDRELLAV